MGWEVEAEVGVSTFCVMVIGFIHMLRNRAAARARAIELDFTNGADEEDTMCPVCHESTPLPQPDSFRFRLALICNGAVYESNGRVLKCGHELCAGELVRSIDDPNLRCLSNM
jgi:hypothetical protein